MTRETLPETFRRMSETSGYATPPGPAACWWQQAQAIRAAERRGWWLHVEPDNDYEGGRFAGDTSEGPYFGALLMSPGGAWDEDPVVLASLWGIDAPEGDPYYGAVFAELASEALADED